MDLEDKEAILLNLEEAIIIRKSDEGICYYNNKGEELLQNILEKVGGHISQMNKKPMYE
jgi:hypothetical protein